MLSYGDRVRRYKVEPKINFNYWRNRIKILLQRFTENYESIPLGQRCDIFFHDLIKDNLESVKNIYSKNSLEFNNLANDEIQEYIDLNKRGKHGQIIYDLDDYEVNQSDFYKSFDFYF